MKTAAAIALGCTALIARPELMTLADPSLVLAIVFVVLAALALRAPSTRENVRGVIAITVAGVGAFVLGHLVVPAAPAAPNAPRIVALLILAAVAEELFFRRLVFGALRPRGETVAILGSAWLFAVVHVTVYGWYALPLDLAAGLLLSWQRSATGTWRAPAVTHVAANLLGVL